MPRKSEPATVDMTVSQVARELHIRRETVLAFIRAGRLVGYDVTAPGAKRKSYRITRTAVDDFKKQQTVQPQVIAPRRSRTSPKPENVTEFF